MSFPFTTLRHEGTAPIGRYQVYGERCSGTNFLIRLMERNVTSARYTEGYGFKHWFVPEALTLPADTLGLVVTREPVAWVRSLHEKAWHLPEETAALPLPTFLGAEWRCVWDDHWLGVGEDHPQYGTEMTQERDPATGERLPGPLAVRYAKHRNWSQLAARSPAFARLRHEDLKADPEGFLDALSAFGLSRGAYEPITSYKGEANEPYLPKRRPPLPDETRAAIEARLDRTAEAEMGY